MRNNKKIPLLLVPKMLPEGKKFGGIGGNLTWWMQRNANFGENLIWRISTKLNMINAFLSKNNIF